MIFEQYFKYVNFENFKKINKLNEEEFNGNIEYKQYLFDLSKKRITKLATQMDFRLREGEGEAIYYIGVNDNGYTEGLQLDLLQSSLNNLYLIANIIDSRIVDFKFFKGYGGYISKIILNKKLISISLFNDE